MKVTHTATIPPTGRRHGVVFNTVGATYRARAMAVPVQPRTPTAVAGTLAVSTIAALWITLPSGTQSLWAAGLPPGVSGYNFFLKQNTLNLLWGVPMVIDPPTLPVLTGVTLVNFWPDPGGVAMSIQIVLSVPPPAGTEPWVRVYFQPNQTLAATASGASAAPFFGSFYCGDPSGQNFFDCTALWYAVAGQWWYPSTLDTATHVHCGNGSMGYWYVTDAAGQIGTTGSANPVAANFMGPNVGIYNPGVCPILTSPPFPWPTHP